MNKTEILKNRNNFLESLFSDSYKSLCLMESSLRLVTHCAEEALKAYDEKYMGTDNYDSEVHNNFVILAAQTDILKTYFAELVGVFNE